MLIDVYPSPEKRAVELQVISPDVPWDKDFIIGQDALDCIEQEVTHGIEEGTMQTIDPQWGVITIQWSIH